MVDKRSSEKGMLLTDIMVSFSLVAIFATVLVSSLDQVRNSFYRAREMKILLDVFDQNHDMMILPYSNQSSIFEMQGREVR